MPANTKVRCDVHALVRVIICHRQAFDAPGDGARPANGIAHKAHPPGLVHCQGSHQRHAHANALGPFTFPDRQAFSGVKTVDPLVIDARVLEAQNVVNHAVNPTPARMGSFNYFVAQFRIKYAGLALMAIDISA